MTDYAVLWLPEEGSAERASRSGERGRLGPEAESSVGARVTREAFDERQAAEARESPRMLLAREMPVRLIAPVGAAGDLDGPVDGDSWGIAAVDAEGCGLDGRGARVAVLDTGIDAGHPAFAGLKPQLRNFTADGPDDRHGHGTHCAGTVFGRDVDGRRIGVARGVEDVLVGKVLDDRGAGTSVAVHEGLMWAIESGVDVVALSLGLDYPGQVAELVDNGWPMELAASIALADYSENLKLFQALVETSGQARFGTQPLIVAASGNESRRSERDDFVISTSLPASVFHLSVGAIGQDPDGLRVADFSNGPPKVVAPGVEIVSAWPGGGLATLSGTSMACPHVAGLAALWAGRLRRDGEVVDAEILKSHLLASAKRDRVAASKDVRDVGRGLVTAPRA